MIRYDVALAISGVIVTVMGILIAFEITFPTEIYSEAGGECFCIFIQI